MSASGIRTLTNLSDNGYYLPAIASGVLYLENATFSLFSHRFSPEIFLFFTLFLLIAGTVMHSLEEAVSGPKSKREPTNYREGIQRVYHALYAEGRPSDYPREWTGLSEIDYELSKGRLLLSLIVGLLYISLIISYPTTIINLFDILASAKYTAGVVIFLELAFMSQAINEFIWPYSYLESQKVEKLGLVDERSEFRTTLSYLESIELIDTTYELTDGGIFYVSYKLDSNDEENIVDSIESVAYIYKATIGVSEYPCNKLHATIFEGEEEVGEYFIERIWLEKLKKDEISHSDFIKQVLDSFRFP